MSEFASYPSLRDKVVFVSGGTTGIGADMVPQFAAQGAKVGFCGRNEEAANEVVQAAVDAGGTEPLFVKLDLRDIDALKAALTATADRFGPITGLVNNAAHDERHDWREVTPDDWDDGLNVNLRHQFFAIQAVAPAMAEAGGGAIVNLGSTSWMLKNPDMPAYTTSKAAIHGLTSTMARALGPDSIRVNCLVAGAIMTERQLTKWLTPEAEAMFMQQQCLKRRLYPPEVTRMAMFLIADDSSACTAQSYVVDGGRVGPNP